MAKLKLKDKWEFIEDDANGRMKIRAGDTGNEFIFNEDGTLDDVTAKITNGVVYAGHPDFNSLQAALDWANTNGHNQIFVPHDAEYSENIVPYSQQRIFSRAGAQGYGAKIDGGTSGHAIDVSGTSGVTLEGLTLSTTPGAGNPYDNIHASDTVHLTVFDCMFGNSDRHGVYFDGPNNPARYNIITHSDGRNGVDNDTVYIGSNVDRLAVIACTGGAGFSITNNGTLTAIHNAA